MQLAALGVRLSSFARNTHAAQTLDGLRTALASLQAFVSRCKIVTEGTGAGGGNTSHGHLLVRGLCQLSN